MALTVLRYWRLPFWLMELATEAKSFADNPLLGSRRLNRLGLHGLRVRSAAMMTSWRRWLLRGGVSAEDRACFREQGFVLWPDVLPTAQFEAMRAAIVEHARPAREMAQGHTVTRRFAVNSEMLRAIPELKMLIAAPRWRGLLRYVAATRAEPHYYIQTILTHRAEGTDDPQNAVHADTFHSTMKAWLFLTDVTLADGPLSYVRGSHRLDAARRKWERERGLTAAREQDRLSARGSPRVRPGELEALGLPVPQPFTVTANTLVVADTFGFHARTPSTRPSIRIELWAYTRRNPFLPWTGLSAGSLPGLVHRRVTLFWRLQDRFPKLLRRSMLPVGAKRPDAC